MARPKKSWSKSLVDQSSGIRVRIYERLAGGPLQREVRHGDGSKDRTSLRHTDRQRAETDAKALLQRLAELRNAGQTTALTFGQLELLFRKHRFPLLSATRQRTVKGMLPLLLVHFRRDAAVVDLSQHMVDGYTIARRSGAIKSARHRGEAVGVRTGTIRNELHLLQAMCEWAQGYRVDGRRLLTLDPFAGVVIPAEKNMRRPVATEDRFRALLAVADQADQRGRFRAILALARFTGRRINAICNLKVSDVLRTKDQMLAALGTFGMDLGYADQWPNGAIAWASDTDKLGFQSIAPMSKAARDEIDRYLREHPRVGDGPLFSATEDPSKAVHKELARYWLRRAEGIAELTSVDRGGFHSFRRLWASERRHLPAQDVAAAGGWRSIQVMRDAYQQATADVIQSVVENGPQEHTADTPNSKVAEAQ